MKDMFKNPAKYKKFWAALVAPLGVLLFVMSPADGQTAFSVTRAEWFLVVVALAAAAGVRQVPNSNKKSPS